MFMTIDTIAALFWGGATANGKVESARAAYNQSGRILTRDRGHLRSNAA
jgi:hypothetical protein